MNFLKLKNELLSNTDLEQMNKHVSIENISKNLKAIKK